jgi:hypothetical protein
VTSTQLYVRRNFNDADKERILSTNGFLGQLGALGFNAIACAVVAGNVIGGPGHGP